MCGDASPAASLFPFTALHLTCPVVGRRHYSARASSTQSTLTSFFSAASAGAADSDAATPPSSAVPACLSAGAPFMLLREPNNARDPNAIKVRGACSLHTAERAARSCGLTDS